MSHPPPASVIVHPLVLLSVVDHWRRVARDTRKRVVGVLLGERLGSGATARVDITNSFAGEEERGGEGEGEERGGDWADPSRGPCGRVLGPAAAPMGRPSLAVRRVDCARWKGKEGALPSRRGEALVFGRRAHRKKTRSPPPPPPPFPLTAPLSHPPRPLPFPVTVPFEEDERDPAVWFFDHSYAESMLAMFRKVNGELERERERE